MGAIELGKLNEILDRLTIIDLTTKDIIAGSNIAKYVSDLKTNGTSSVTYKDSERMGELIASKDVANNKDVAKYLVQWAADNNKFGTYCGSACGAVSNVTWNALTTPSAVTGSVNAFTALCENSIAMTEVLKNKKCKQAIWGNLSICDAIIRKSNNAISILRGIGVNGSFNAEDYGVTTGKFFVNYVTVGNRDYFTARITYAPGGEQEDVKEIGYGEKKSILRFATRLEAVDITGMNFNYVDFS